MTSSLKRAAPLALALAIGAMVLILWRYNPDTVGPIPPGPSSAEENAPPSAARSVLAEAPDWSSLNRFQNTITREDFERLLTTVFVTGGTWRNFIELDDRKAVIRTGTDSTGETFHLHFAVEGLAESNPRHWRTTSELPPAPANKPLEGLHIAIDPGHIGGEWAKVEERWLQIDGGKAICEGDMTLLVARLLQPRLEVMGAKVSFVRNANEPVTPLRPESLVDLAKDSQGAPDSPAALQKFAERLFYRTAEIRARAKLVNETIKPDLVLCLHFNADPWGDPTRPTLVERSHLHLLLNGAYTDEEIALEDQRFAMLSKLLSRTHEEEASIGATVADVFAHASGLPPFVYPAGAANALPVNGHPYLWARNLLANRLYDSPVIFMEPYVMNSTIDYPRLQAGDYEGMREIAGKPQASIFREYADALAEGLEKHYSSYRAVAQ